MGGRQELFVWPCQQTNTYDLFDFVMASSSKKEAAAAPVIPKSLDTEITKYKVYGRRCSPSMPDLFV